MTRLKLHLAQGHMICRWQSELQLSLALKLTPSNTTGIPYVSYPYAFLSLHGDFSASWGISKAHFSPRVIIECLTVIFFASLYVICACTSLCRCVHMHTRTMWKPQVNVKCLSQLSYVLFFSDRISYRPRSSQVWLGWQVRDQLISAFQHHSHKHAPPHFHSRAGDPNSGTHACLYGKYFTDRATSLAWLFLFIKDISSRIPH